MAWSGGTTPRRKAWPKLPACMGAGRATGVTWGGRDGARQNMEAVHAPQSYTGHDATQSEG